MNFEIHTQDFNMTHNYCFYTVLNILTSAADQVDFLIF